MSWTLYWVLLAIGIVMTGIFLFLRVKKGGISALYAKAAASLCFISTAFAATSANRDNIQFGLWVAFGLILGMVGDIWLDLKWIYLQDKDSYLYSGFISFLLGHICFNVAIYKSYRFTEQNTCCFHRRIASYSSRQYIDRKAYEKSFR